MTQLLSDQSEVSGNLQSIAENGYSDQIAKNEYNGTVLGGLIGKRDLYAVGEGELALGTKAGLAVNTATRFADKLGLFGGDTTPNSEYDKLDQVYLDALKQSRPDPNTTGYVAQIANGLIGTVPFYMLPVVGIPAAMAVEGNTSFKESRDQGLTQNQSIGKASIDAMWAGIYGKLPTAFAGGRVVSAIKGAAAMSVAGMVNRESTSLYLENIGHQEMADQYKAFDTQSLFTDLVFGAAFGFVHGSKMPDEPNQTPPPPSLVAAAAVANESKHLEINSAEGIPETSSARQAHNQAFELALQQIQTEKLVDVGNIIKGESFIDHPIDSSIHDIIAKTLVDNGYDEAINNLRATEETAKKYGIENTPDSYDSLKNYKVNNESQKLPEQEIIKTTDKSSIIPDDSGNPLPAHEALQESDNQIQSSIDLAKGAEVAADCAMRFGE